MDVYFFPNKKQRARLDCQAISSKERAAGYPIIGPIQTFMITFHCMSGVVICFAFFSKAKRTFEGFVQVCTFDYLFPKKREQTAEKRGKLM